MSELDWSEVPYPPEVMGQSQPIAEPSEDDHAPHAFLYVPDLAERTGWNTHRVPERKPEPQDRRVGFRR